MKTTVFLIVWSFFVGIPSGLASTCQTVAPGLDTLQGPARSGGCVQLQAGVYLVSSPVVLETGTQIMGAGRELSTVRATANYSSPVDAMLTADANANNISLRDFTVDAAGISVGGVGASGITLDGMGVANAACWGVGIAGPGMVIRGSLIEQNGASPTCNAPPGAGIYATQMGFDGNLAPYISDNIIRNNVGPAVDINGVSGGTLSGNTIYGNSSWAAVSLYQSSYWSVTKNVITQASVPQGQPYHTNCSGGPAGPGSAAIFLCVDDATEAHASAFNLITNNQASSFYGILSIGIRVSSGRVIAPHSNVYLNNNVYGSRVGCADEMQPGMWSGYGFSGNDAWMNNNCTGVWNSAPGGF